MVARGDLSAELPIEDVPLLQVNIQLHNLFGFAINYKILLIGFLFSYIFNKEIYKMMSFSFFVFSL